MDALYFGALVFYGKPTAVSHVGIALDPVTMIEAGGGGSTTTTIETAAKANAYIRLRPMRRRLDFVAIIRPAELAKWPTSRYLLARSYMLAFLGLPYRWGGDDPINGFDCSGFALEYLKAFGLWGADDATAHELYSHFLNQPQATRLALLG